MSKRSTGYRVLYKMLGCTAVLPFLAANAAAQTAISSGDLLPFEAEALRQGGIDRQALHCNSDRSWQKDLHHRAKETAMEVLTAVGSRAVVPQANHLELLTLITDTVFWQLVRTVVVEGAQHNLGAVPVRGLRTKAGEPVTLIRSGFTPRPGEKDSCFFSLVTHARVRHVTNLYAGAMHTEDLESAERLSAQAVGGTYTNAREGKGPQSKWRDELRADDSTASRREAMQAVAAVVDGVVHPQGQLPVGNLLVHCGGGMHRTGMVVGVVEKCWNHADMAQIAAGYKRHVAWRSDADPGGYEAANLAFIQDFDCSLLQVQPQANSR